MLQQLTETQIKAVSRHKGFHQKIVEKASGLRPAPSRTYTIQNVPYGQRKPGVRTLPVSRYIQPSQFTLAYEAAWMLEICGLEVAESYSSKMVMDRVKRTVAGFYGINQTDLLSHRRTKHLILPRHIAMYLCKSITLRSLPEIGRAFADRDHTTIMHAARKIEALIKRDKLLATVVATLRDQCGGGAQ